MQRREPSSRRFRTRHLVIPVVLVTVAIAGVVSLVGSAAGCGDDSEPRVDASVGDAAPDTPIV